ncbi:MAG TPA: class E sortase, partial [Acidimicrobiia bacterium]|nr:class E sortase [Acidimicrobiia bacterium]
PGTSSTTDDEEPSSTTTTLPEPPPIPPDGEAVAIIRIPKIGVDKVVVEGTTVADLRKGPGHYSGTPLPGQIGNAAIAGHRTTYGAPFGSLDQLAEGDIITVETLSGSFDYRIVEGGVFVVKPSQVEVLDQPPPDEPEATLTLTSCNPKYSARERIVVKAEYDLRANQPQPQAPSTETRAPKHLDAGLSGSHSTRLPTLLWGLLAAIAGGLWWVVFHRYRRWTTWVAGAIVFAPVLFVFYVFLERVLPSNY